MGFASALRAFRAAVRFQSGRRAFLAKKYEEALKYFRQAAQTDPAYVFVSGNFREGIWTFIGRTQYNLERLAEARQSLQRAVAASPDDCLAKLFLGLILARGNEHAEGRRELESGLRCLYGWIEQANSRDPFNAFWDPQREIRAVIEKCLAQIFNKELDFQELVASGEWLGQRMEEEIDHVRRDESRRLNEM